MGSLLPTRSFVRRAVMPRTIHPSSTQQPQQLKHREFFCGALPSPAPSCSPAPCGPLLLRRDKSPHSWCWCRAFCELHQAIISHDPLIAVSRCGNSTTTQQHTPGTIVTPPSCQVSELPLGPPPPPPPSNGHDSLHPRHRIVWRLRFVSSQLAQFP